MIDWGALEGRHERFQAEAAQWGISSGDRFDLEALCRSNLNPPETFEQDDWVDLDFRSAVAEVLSENGLGKKAGRFSLFTKGVRPSVHRKRQA
jgi:hypothetical protein